MGMKNHNTWLNLSDAARLLGIHPATLRHWADQGHVPFFRTAGGHRRFRYDDIVNVLQEGMHNAKVAHLLGTNQWPTTEEETDIGSLAMEPATKAVMQKALGHTQNEIEERSPHFSRWYYAFDQEGRQRMREQGRHLFILSIQYVLKQQNREEILERGRHLGWLHGESSIHYGISLVETVRAFNFFRRSLLETLETRGTPERSPDIQDMQIGDVVDAFLSEVLYSVIGAYESAFLETS